MKRFSILMWIAVVSLAAGACNLNQSADAEKKEVQPVDTAAAPISGTGLSEEEATALLREEKVEAGININQEDVEMEILRMGEEIQADIEGREPDFEKAGVKAELKPLLAKETFTVEAASSKLDYDRDMAVMALIREYVKKKKAEEAGTVKKDAPAATATHGAADSSPSTKN